MELNRLFSILRRWSLAAVLCVAVSSGAGYWFASQQPRVYEAKARYLIGPAITDPNVDSSMLRATAQLGQTYAEIATSRPVVQAVIEQLKLDSDVDTVTQNIDATWIEGTMFLTIKVRGTDPETTAAIANSIGDALIERSPDGPLSQQMAQRQYARDQIEKLQASIVTTQDQIKQLGDQIQAAPDQLAQRRLIIQLDERRTELSVAQRALQSQYAVLQSSSANQIAAIEPAVPNLTPIAPLVSRIVVVAAMTGLVLWVLAVWLLEFFADAVALPGDVRKATRLPFLGNIARRRRLRGPGIGQLIVAAQPDSIAAEGYRMLRASLRAFSRHRPLKSLLVTSPSRGDGKSEVAANLALSFAQAGKSVILIDANLRSPALGTLFGLPDQHGLSDLLRSDANMPQAVVVPSCPNLEIVPAGPDGAPEVLESPQLQALLQACYARADMVIVDSPPLLYSDALALAPYVDGVMLVAKSATTTQQSLTRAAENLQIIGARVVGTVLNQVKPARASKFYRERAGVAAAATFVDAKPGRVVDYGHVMTEQTEQAR